MPLSPEARTLTTQVLLFLTLSGGWCQVCFLTPGYFLGAVKVHDREEPRLQPPAECHCPQVPVCPCAPVKGSRQKSGMGK